MPSTSRPLRSSNDISAPSTSTLAFARRPQFLQARRACSSSAARSGPSAFRWSPRRPALPASSRLLRRSTCRAGSRARRAAAGGAVRSRPGLPRRRRWRSSVEPSDWTTSTFSGSSTFRSVASGTPKPDGRELQRVGFGCDHLPSTSGESFGFFGAEELLHRLREGQFERGRGGDRRARGRAGGDDRRAGRREPGDGLELAGVLPRLRRAGDDRLAGGGLLAERDRAARLVEAAVLQFAGLPVDDLADRAAELEARVLALLHGQPALFQLRGGRGRRSSSASSAAGEPADRARPLHRRFDRDLLARVQLRLRHDPVALQRDRDRVAARDRGGADAGRLRRRTIPC